MCYLGKLWLLPPRMACLPGELFFPFKEKQVEIPISSLILYPSSTDTKILWFHTFWHCTSPKAFRLSVLCPGEGAGRGGQKEPLDFNLLALTLGAAIQYLVKQPGREGGEILIKVRGTGQALDSLLQESWPLSPPLL